MPTRMVVAVTPWLGGVDPADTEPAPPRTTMALRISEPATREAKLLRIADLHGTGSHGRLHPGTVAQFAARRDSGPCRPPPTALPALTPGECPARLRCPCARRAPGWGPAR